jgi:hypothetical protein
MLATAHYATRQGLNRPFARVTARDRRMGHKLRHYGADAPSVWVALGGLFIALARRLSWGCWRPGCRGQ